MARQAGRDSQLYVSVTSGGAAAPMLHTAAANANYATAKLDVTAFGDTNMTYVSGLPDGQLQFSGFATDTAATALLAAALDGLARRWYFYPFASRSIYTYGTGFFDWTQEVEVGGEVKFSSSMAPATAIGTQGFS